MWFIDQLGVVAAASGCTPNATFEFAQWALLLLHVQLQRGNANLYRELEIVISRDQGLRKDACPKDTALPDGGVCADVYAVWPFVCDC